jgi:hypothetical protein
MLVIAMRMVTVITDFILTVINHITVLFLDDFKTDVDYLCKNQGSFTGPQATEVTGGCRK